MEQYYETEGESFNLTYPVEELELDEAIESKPNSLTSVEEDETETVDRPKNACIPNRFFLSFQHTPFVGDSCLNEDQIKCKAFWKFVDSHPNLKDSIKNGYSPKPVTPSVIPCDENLALDPRPESNSCHRTVSEEIRSLRVFPIEVKERIETERRRFQARRDAVKALQLKSGQPLVVTGKRAPTRIRRNIYADEAASVLECGFPPKESPKSTSPTQFSIP